MISAHGSCLTLPDCPKHSEPLTLRDLGASPARCSTLWSFLCSKLTEATVDFYDPQQPRRSLGTWSILWLVEQCRRNGQPFVYLGYWISDSPKMAYKARFPALERLADGAWAEFTSDAAGPLPFSEG